jgi:hypothetical protein
MDDWGNPDEEQSESDEEVDRRKKGERSNGLCPPKSQLAFQARRSSKNPSPEQQRNAQL